MGKERILLGKKGEELVSAFLEKSGFTILEQNYRSRHGEIDLIAAKGTLLAFVEVKLRRNPAFCLSELIIPSKQKKIITTALWYINQHKLYSMTYRFDVGLIDYTDSAYTLSYINNAFTSCETFSL